MPKSLNSVNVFTERAAKLVEQQERDRVLQQQQASPRAGTPVGSIMGVVLPPSVMGMLNQAMPPVPGNAKSPPPLLKETDAASGHPPTVHIHLNHLKPQLINHVSIFPVPKVCPISDYSVHFTKLLLFVCKLFGLVFLNIATFFFTCALFVLHDNRFLLTC